MNYWLNSYYYPSSTKRGLRMASIERPAETVWITETGSCDATPGNGYNFCYPSYFTRTVPTNGTYGANFPAAAARLTDRHFGGPNVIWGDGHVKWVKLELLESDNVGVNEAGAQSKSKYWWGR